jgi:hypothetical protein
MKNNNKININFVGLKLYKDILKAGAMVSLSNGNHLKALLKKVGVNITVLTLLSTREIHRFTLVHNFGVHILKIYKNHGDTFTVKYLKACQLAIQKFIAGTPLKSLREVEPDLNLPRLTTSGLPYVIRIQDRRSLGNSSVRIIRFWLSLFSIYRILKVPFNPKLNTITDDFNGNQVELEYFNDWLSSKTKSKVTNFRFDFNPKDLAPNRLLPIKKSSSLGGESWKGLLPSFLLIKNNPIIWSAIGDYLSLCSGEWMKSLLNNLNYITEKCGDSLLTDSKYRELGRLAFKEEAAGKLRVFAMVDVLTQSLLEPLHKILFNFFKLLPNDGTHDQESAFNKAMDLSIKYGASYGFDLSSATDRLPVSSQVSLLNALFGCKIGDAWKSILVSRSYHIAENSYSLPVGPIYYKVGQPMGALSSWAMLNLLHHMMVQFCADTVGKVKFTEWYTDYLVLGDDLVLFDEAVANCYLALSKSMGVEINLKKSIIAPKRPVVEFAKRTAVKGVDVSALSFKDFVMNSNFFGRLSIVTRLIRRKYGKDLWKLFLFGNKAQVFKEFKYPMIGYLTQVANSKKSTFNISHLLSLLTDKGYPLSYFGRNLNWLSVDTLIKVTKAVIEGRFKQDLISYTDRKWSKIKEDQYKLVLLSKIFTLYNKLKSLSFEKEAFRARELASNFKIEQDYFKSLVDSGKSLELTKPLFSRTYYKDFAALSFKIRESHLVNRLFSAFFNEKVWVSKAVSYKGLWQGWEVDLSRPKVLKETFELVPLLGYSTDFAALVKTQLFSKLTVDYLVDLQARLITLISEIKFADKPVERKEKVIDNPIKVLDFIKDSQNPKYKSLFKLKSDFLLMEGKVVDSIFVNMDHQPGFRPKFNFTIAPKTKK